MRSSEHRRSASMPQSASYPHNKNSRLQSPRYQHLSALLSVDVLFRLTPRYTKRETSKSKTRTSFLSVLFSADVLAASCLERQTPEFNNIAPLSPVHSGCLGGQDNNGFLSCTFGRSPRPRRQRLPVLLIVIPAENCRVNELVIQLHPLRCSLVFAEDKIT